MADAAAFSKHESLGDRAYREIKQRIIAVSYGPGSVLNEMQVSETLDIGRTPVRDALRRLAQEGFVDIIPRKGVIVRPVSMDEVADIIEARLVVEPYAAGRAAARATASALKELEAICADAATELAAADGVAGLMQLDQRFHIWIAEQAGNRVIAEILQRLHERALRFWFLSLSDGAHPARVQEEHEAILQAIAAKDPDAAERATRTHIESFRNIILQVI